MTGGVGGLNLPAKISDPPAAIKKRKGNVDFLFTYALARSSTSIAKTSTPSLMKFDKYSPGIHTVGNQGQEFASGHQVIGHTGLPNSLYPAHRTEGAFRCSAPAVWNSRPQTALSSDSVAVFKLRLKTFLFSQAFSSFSAH